MGKVGEARVLTSFLPGSSADCLEVDFAPLSRTMSGTAKLHHYVPQFYLRQWCSTEGKFWVYPTDGRAPFRATPRNFAAESHLYTAKADADAVRHDTEAWFAGWEGLFANKWPDLIDRAEDPRTRRSIARFLGTLIARHPEERDGVAKLNEHLIAAVDGAASEGTLTIQTRDSEVKLKVSEVREYARTDEESVRTDFIRLMPAMANTLAETLLARNWGVVFSKHRSFITSDHPVSLDRGSTRKATFGFGTPGSLLFFPVSPYRFLVIADDWEFPFMHYKLDDEAVFIRRVVRSAERFVFSDRNDARIVAAIQNLRLNGGG